MKKYKIITLLLLNSFFVIFSQTLTGKEYIDEVWRGYDENGTFQRGVQRLIFSDTTVHYKEWFADGKVSIEEYLYQIENIEGINYLLLFGKDKLLYKWLMLFSEDILILYDNDDYPFFLGNNIDSNSLHFAALLPVSDGSDKASSELSEQLNGVNVTYPIENISLAQIPNPWAEGAEGNGIGEWLEYGLDGYNSRHPISRYLYFSNGYVSYNRPDLYKANGRLKRIRITQPMNNQVREFDLEDTPNLQKIFLDKEMDGEKLIIEILDVYPGEKYSDTCLNHMFYYEIYD